MKNPCARAGIFAAVAVLFLAAGSTTAWGEGPPPCPASPNYVDNFDGDQSCLALNGDAAFFPVSGSPKLLRLTPALTFQAGSAWFKSKQTVASGFSTTFTFRISGGNTGLSPADGIAFVIQNAADTALGPDGCGIGYGQNPFCTSGSGIPNSLAVEFDTYNNGTPDNDTANHVAIQSCLTGANSSDNSGSCNIAMKSPLPVTLADGNIHSVTITYTPRPANCGQSCFGKLDVILDDNDLFPGGVDFDLASIGLHEGTSAWVGFTAATGGGDDDQDILTWTYTPESQSVVVKQGEEAVAPFQDDAYSYGAQLNAGDPTTVTITPILTDQATCNNLVGTNFPGAKCFVYTGLSPNPDSSVMFELTCPQLPSNPECSPFDAELATRYDIADNPDFDPANPFPGWLKGHGDDPAHPCTPPAQGPLFTSNQIDFFSINRDDPHTKGGSGGTGSCWVATYNQPDEERPGINITSPTGTYAQNQVVTANYTCSDPSTSKLPPPDSLVGPYLTTASCTQTTQPETGSCQPNGSGLTCTGAVDTSTLGPHTFEVKAFDTGTNSNTQSVSYTVVAPADLAILKLALPKIPTGKKLVYGIAAVDLGANPAVGVVVTDPLPSGTSFVSASGSNVSCAFVNGKLKCSTTPVSCTINGTVVTCNVGTLSPFSWWALNGAAIQITVQVNATPGTTLKNTATVSGTNTDPKPGNNSSTATTVVTR